MRFIKANPIFIKSAKLLITLLFLSAGFYSCEEQPSDLGLNYVPAGDTTGTNVLYSTTDTMMISSSNYKYAVNTSAAAKMLVGRYQQYESRGLLKFTGITGDFDSASIISASLSLRYSGYTFGDSNTSAGFDIVRLNKAFDFSTVNRDSVSSSDYGTTVLGSYSGMPTDSVSINVALDNQLVKDWLEYAADTNYSVKNYGIGLIPNGSSASIKGFNSSLTQSNIPTVTVILSKNGTTDTISFSESSALFIADAPASIIPADRFVVEGGIAFRDFLKFDLSKLPANVIVNDARLELTLDRTSSVISSETSTNLGFAIITDSVNKKDTLLSVPGNVQPGRQIISGDVFLIKITPIVQLWNSGLLANLGTSIYSTAERFNIDKFVFYSPTSPDVSKIPKLRIIYTPRN